ncbi:MAG: efflux RND transporter periplasmic adaptor subunit [Xanthomonadales bacterium]|nr:efflux RND transporter periplasmic adaptor subunit [Xanthomonadales bacterium]
MVRKGGKLIRIVWKPLLILVVSIVLFQFMMTAKAPPEKRTPEQQAMLVNVVPAHVEAVQFRIESQGTVAPRTETTLVAEVAGKIVDVSPNYIAGGFFRKGDTLLRIDPSDYEVSVRQAEAALAGRQAQLAQEQARSEQARRDWEKLDRPGENPPPLVLRKPQLAEARAAVLAAEADLAKAERELERTVIRAPYDGLVRSKRADVGQYVAPGTTLGVTFAVDEAEVRLPLSDRDLAFLDLPDFTVMDAENQPRVMLSANIAGQLREREGVIVRTEGVFDPNTRVIYAVARIVDPYSAFGEERHPVLPVGTFVRAEIDGLSGGELVRLPRHTVQGDGTVLVADAEDRLEIRSVEVVRSDERYSYISAGLGEGDRVVTTSVEVPIPGTPLEIAKEPETADRDAATAMIADES